MPWLTLADVHQLRDGTRLVVEDTAEKVSLTGIRHSSAVSHPAGTVAMSRTASVGFSCIMGTTMATSQDFVTWTCGDWLDNRFLLWALRGERAQILSRMQGSTHKTIYMPDLEDLKISLPPVAEQRAIADYLDVETARIDALIAKKQQLIHLLEERLTEGVRALVTGRDQPGERWTPGPSWLGSVPTIWQPMKIAWRKRTGSGTTPKSDAGVFYDGGEVPWVTTSELRESVITATTKCVTHDAVREHSALTVFPTGTILVAMYGATVGRVGVLGVPATTNQACCAIYGCGELRQEFLYWWLRVHRTHLLDLAYGAGQPNISQETVRSLRVPAPRESDQLERARLADRLSDRLGTVRYALTRQVSLLAEHRQALITAAVTGE